MVWAILSVVMSARAAEQLLIPGATFTMGCDPAEDSRCAADESPPHSVTLASYWIDRYEATQAEWGLCVQAGACRLPVTSEALLHDSWPVTGITRAEAVAYCAWRTPGGRLPTEAEWEYAARGPDGRLYPWGEGEPTCERAQLRSCGSMLGAVGTHPSGASPFGVEDMIGNAWELVADDYNPTFYGASPGSAPFSDDILDMANIRSPNLYGAEHLVLTSRNGGPSSIRAAVLGFRCARSGE